MRRILLMLTVTVLMAAMMVVMAAPAFAAKRNLPAQGCSHERSHKILVGGLGEGCFKYTGEDAKPAR